MDYQHTLKEVFGFNTFQKGQEEIIKLIMNGKSAIALFSTSAGKSLCYQLPTVLLPGLTLVVSPLLSLMKDQSDYLNSINIPSGILDSTLNTNEVHQLMLDVINDRIKILFVSPERFKNMSFRRHISSTEVSLLVIDEAHCISEWGHDFRPSYMKLPYYRIKLGIKRVLLLTATATQTVVQDMATSFKIPKKNIIRVNKVRNNLYLGIKHITNDKPFYLIERLRQNPNEPTIIYVREKKQAEDLSIILKSRGLTVGCYHSDMPKKKRDEVQDRFFRNELSTVIATKGFGMGINKEDIRFIYHYNIPSSPEEYVQQTGRAGRDGNLSICEVLYSTDDAGYMRKILSNNCDDKLKSNICTFISQFKNPGFEINLTQCAKQLDMTESTLHTIMIYLEQLVIIRYGDVNSRNHEIRILSHEIDNLSDDERLFLNHLKTATPTFSQWISINVYQIGKTLHMEPSDILKVMDDLKAKDVIDLKFQQLIDTDNLEVLSFNIDRATEDIFNIFKKRADQAVSRFNDLESILTSGKCIKNQLDEYFGNKPTGKCGSCSVCTVLNSLSRVTFQLPLTSLILYQNLNGQSLLP